MEARANIECWARKSQTQESNELRTASDRGKIAAIVSEFEERLLNNSVIRAIACVTISHYLYTVLALRHSKLVVDVGCSRGDSMLMLRRFGLSCYAVGVDLFPPYLHECKRQSIHDDYVIADANNLPFKANAFDTSLCLEVIEHSDKSNGHRILEEIERVSNTCIVTSPVDWGLGVNVDDQDPYQLHRSQWKPEDLKRLGYEVKGFWGLKIPSAPTISVMLSGVIFAPLVSILPRYALHMLGLKTKSCIVL